MADASIFDTPAFKLIQQEFWEALFDSEKSNFF